MFMTQKTPVCSCTPAFSSLQPRILQRCSRGGSSSSGGQCGECKKTELQRRATAGAHSGFAPPIVHEVLRSPGRPLDAATRAVFEPRFGHDFSKVRIHADAQANESARSVSALAYTVGSQIVLGAGPGAATDMALLAHELTHVVQQSQAEGSTSTLRIGESDSPFEKEADHVANAILSSQPTAPPVHTAASALQRQPAQKPAQSSASTTADPVWGSKNWPGEENDWNALYQQAIQGLAGGKLKPDRIAHFAATIADLSMLLFHHHGKQMWCAMNATNDQQSKYGLNLVS
jgi:hypothetical protein